MQSNPAPMRPTPQRHRRSDRYLVQEQAPVTQQPVAPPPVQPAAPSSLPERNTRSAGAAAPRTQQRASMSAPQPMPTPGSIQRQTSAMTAQQPANSVRPQPQRQASNMSAPQPMPTPGSIQRASGMTAQQPVNSVRPQPQRQASNMSAPQPMPTPGNTQSMSGMPAQQAMNSVRQQPYQTSMVAPQPMPQIGNAPQPYQTSMVAPQPIPQPGNAPQPYQTSMVAPQPIPQPGNAPQPYQPTNMSAPQPMPRMPMNGQPAPYPQQPGYYGQPRQQPPYYGPEMMAAQEPRPGEPQPIIDPIDQPRGRTFFGGSGGFGGPPKKLLLMIGAVAAAILLLVGGVIGIRTAVRENGVRAYVSAYDAKFCEGVYVDGIHLGGMTQQEGVDAVTTQAQQRNNDWYVRLTYQGQTVVELNAAQLGMKVDVIDVLREAWSQGHASNDAHERQAAMQGLLENPYQGYTAVPSGDTSVVDSVLADLQAKVYRAPQDAVLVGFDPDRTNPFTIQDEVVGTMLNTDSLKEDIYRMVSVMESGELEIHPEPIMPNVTAEDIRQTVALRADEYTEISTRSTKNRNENIKRALALISGTVIGPGQTFSFNGVVGKRTIENGFYTAPEYQYSREVEGIGGGVCQASTTMYLAAVAANLEITKHTPHSMAVNYTSFGRDATVNMDGKQFDFAFRNNTDSNIYICASVQFDRSISKYNIARVRIYGPSLGEGVTYKLEAEEIEWLPQPEDEIRKDTKAQYVTYTDEEYEYSAGREGHVTQSYKVKYVNGVAVERTPMYKDTYKAAPRVVYVGVEERWMY